MPPWRSTNARSSTRGAAATSSRSPACWAFAVPSRPSREISSRPSRTLRGPRACEANGCRGQRHLPVCLAHGLSRRARCARRGGRDDRRSGPARGGPARACTSSSSSRRAGGFGSSSADAGGARRLPRDRTNCRQRRDPQPGVPPVAIACRRGSAPARPRRRGPGAGRRGARARTAMGRSSHDRYRPARPRSRRTPGGAGATPAGGSERARRLTIAPRACPGARGAWRRPSSGQGAKRGERASPPGRGARSSVRRDTARRARKHRARGNGGSPAQGVADGARGVDGQRAPGRTAGRRRAEQQGNRAGPVRDREDGRGALSHVYRKLEIASRRQLGVALARGSVEPATIGA